MQIGRGPALIRSCCSVKGSDLLEHIGSAARGLEKMKVIDWPMRTDIR